MIRVGDWVRIKKDTSCHRFRVGQLVRVVGIIGTVTLRCKGTIGEEAEIRYVLRGDIKELN